MTEDLNESEKIIAITKLTIPTDDDGPIEVSSTIEGTPSSALFNHFGNIAKQKPYINLERMDVKTDDDDEHKKSEKSDSTATTHCTLTTIKETEPQVPTAPPLSDDTNSDPAPLYHFQLRQHEFTNRTVLRSESCAYCLKK